MFLLPESFAPIYIHYYFEHLSLYDPLILQLHSSLFNCDEPVTALVKNFLLTCGLLKTIFNLHWRAHSH